jgi:hypothetical protein
MLEANKYKEAEAAKKKAEADKLLMQLFKNAQKLGGGGVEEVTSNKEINMYLDPRNGTDKMPDTIITCLHFLEAVEDDKYGWRWECPKGGDKCIYRHQLPEGYTLLTKKEREANKKAKELEELDAKTIEEKIEEERAALKSDGLTPVTKESFEAWKAKRAAKK